jgi:thioredoxin-like negative regulator of GroEL
VLRENYAVVDIYAPWCQPCKEVTAILEELAQKFGDRVLFTKVDGDEHEELIDELGVTAYPTVFLLEAGQIRKKIEGARGLEWYTREIEILLGLRKREKIRNKKANGKLNALSSDTLVEYVEDSIASVIMFYKKGDYECELQTRAMRELAPKYKGRVLFARADVKTEKELAKLFDVEGTPELYFVLDGEVFGYIEVRLTKTELNDAIEQLLEEFN